MSTTYTSGRPATGGLEALPFPANPAKYKQVYLHAVAKPKPNSLIAFFTDKRDFIGFETGVDTSVYGTVVIPDFLAETCTGLQDVTRPGKDLIPPVVAWITWNPNGLLRGRWFSSSNRPFLRNKKAKFRECLIAYPELQSKDRQPPPSLGSSADNNQRFGGTSNSGQGAAGGSGVSETPNRFAGLVPPGIQMARSKSADARPNASNLGEQARFADDRRNSPPRLRAPVPTAESRSTPANQARDVHGIPQYGSTLTVQPVALHNRSNSQPPLIRRLAAPAPDDARNRDNAWRKPVTDKVPRPALVGSAKPPPAVALRNMIREPRGNNPLRSDLLTSLTAENYEDRLRPGKGMDRRQMKLLRRARKGFSAQSQSGL